MAIVTNVTYSTPMPGGARFIAGFATIGTYFTHSNPAMNLANSFNTVKTPVVVLGSKTGYTFDHDGGTAGAGTVIAYEISTKNGSAGALDQVTNNTDLSGTIVPFTAVCEAS